MPSEFLFLEEVAAETRTAISTVRYWITTGKLASIRPGRRRLVRRSDLERFLSGTGAAEKPAPGPEATPQGDDAPPRRD